MKKLTNRIPVSEPRSGCSFLFGGRVVERGHEEFTFSPRREDRVLSSLGENGAGAAQKGDSDRSALA